MTDETRCRLLYATIALSASLVGLAALLAYAALMGHKWAHIPLMILCGAWSIPSLPMWAAAWIENSKRMGK